MGQANLFNRNIFELSSGEMQIGRVKLYYISKFEKADDILSTPDVGRLTGYGKETVRRWIIKGFIPAARCKGRFYISKDDLIEILCSKLYAGIIRKSKVHIEDEINIKKLLEYFGLKAGRNACCGKCQ